MINPLPVFIRLIRAFRPFFPSGILSCFGLVFWAFLLTSCNGGEKPQEPKEPKKTAVEVVVPAFNPDSAFSYVYRQVEFGPRVPGTPEHRQCADWLESILRQFADTVYRQESTVRDYRKQSLPMINLIATFNPGAKRRILLCAHWDTRHVADYDPDKSRFNEPILGANDGASGVGVLLEIARQLQLNPVSIGVDIVLFDVEDQGQPENSNFPYMPDSWCLGSQYWARNPHVPGYRANFGILLDMVGAPNATFTMEATSMTYAPAVMRKVWDVANQAGFGRYFVYTQTGPITDDHLYINKIMNIPTIDIIHRDLTTRTGFGHFWHTHDDNIEGIDRNTLHAVGQTVLTVVYRENAGGLNL